MAFTAFMRKAIGRKGTVLYRTLKDKLGSRAPRLWWASSGVVFVAEEKRSGRSTGIGGRKEGLGRDAALMLEVAKMSRSGNKRVTMMATEMQDDTTIGTKDQNHYQGRGV